MTSSRRRGRPVNAAASSGRPQRARLAPGTRVVVRERTLGGTEVLEEANVVRDLTGTRGAPYCDPDEHWCLVRFDEDGDRERRILAKDVKI